LTKLIVGICIWIALVILVAGIYSAWEFNFIIGAVVIGIGFFIGLIGIVINNNEIIKEKLEK